MHDQLGGELFDPETSPLLKGKPISGYVEVIDREELVALRTRLFDAEAALAELVRLRDDPHHWADPAAWSRARAVLEQIPCGDAPAPCNCDDPVLHRGH
jgi:hypothetical protein